MAESIFQFQDYKEYLLAHAGPKGSRSGMRSELAEAANCHPAYLTQVLNRSAELNLEQGEKISRFLGHTDEELTYFLLLIQHSRAGTNELKRHFQQQITKSAQERLNLRRRLGAKTQLTAKDQLKYYRDWSVAAIHVAFSLPQLKNPEAVARHLNIPIKHVRATADFLQQVGLIKEEAGVWRVLKPSLHLGKDSDHLVRHHTNWRLKALQSLSQSNEDVRYAAVLTISVADAKRLKQLIVETIQSFNQIVAKSPEEEVYAFVTDFFSLSAQSAGVP